MAEHRQLTMDDHFNNLRKARHDGVLSAGELDPALRGFEALVARDKLENELAAARASNLPVEDLERQYFIENERFMQAWDICQRVLRAYT